MRFAIIGSYAALMAQIVVGLGTVPLFLKAFGPERYGLWSALLGVTSYLGLLHLGVAQTVSSRVSTLVDRSPEGVARIARIGLALYFRACTVGLLVVIPATLLVPWASTRRRSQGSRCLRSSHFHSRTPLHHFPGRSGGVGQARA